MPPYAQNTTVPVDRSRAEIERLLKSRGVLEMASGFTETEFTIAWQLDGFRYRITMPLPDRSQFVRTPKGKRRTSDVVESEREKESRRRFRAVLLLMKALFEAVDSGVLTNRQAFNPWLMLPGGQNVTEWVDDNAENVYRSGVIPPLMLSARSE
jgi:hypothetical protein